jgi:hypothetical protein
MAILTPNIDETKASIDATLDNLQSPLRELNREVFHSELDLYQLTDRFHLDMVEP